MMASQGKSNVLHLATPLVATGHKRASRMNRELSTAPEPADYYHRIELYAQKIRQTKDIRDIIDTLEEALSETRALHTANEMAAAHQQVALAEQRIERLKGELELVNRLVREDQLTGALNRRGLDDALKREISRVARASTPLCIAMLDIDNFKNINDSHGHQAGDQVLVHLVDIIQDTIRTNDLIGRYGGEEFLVLLPGSPLDAACDVMLRLQSRLAETPVSWQNLELRVTFSVGVAALGPAETEPDLIGRADKALYEAKQSGKNRVVIAA
ncbi:MAG: GGDEF domain-containing protein [Comamonadaceae bacterium]